MSFQINKEGTTYDVVGIGNAIVDVLAHVEEDFLINEKMTKGTMALIDDAKMLELYKKINPVRECSGGSVANSIAALANLGARTCFMGRIFDDEFGYLFMDDMDRMGVTFNTTLATEGKPTACCLVCVTPDGERTMNTFLGACTEMEPKDLHLERIHASAIIYVEGYLWDQPLAKEAIRLALSEAKTANRKVAFTLSDLFCVERHREEFLELIENGVDILFANEKEAMALCETDNMDNIKERMGPMAEIVLITCSEKGVYILNQDNSIHVPTTPVKVVDATGAGDLFSAGFLYGILQGWDLEKSGQLGHRCASEIIQQIGARVQSSLKQMVA